MAHIRALKRIKKNMEKIQELPENEGKFIIVKINQLDEEWKRFQDLSLIVKDDEDTVKLLDEIEDLYFNLKMSLRKALADLQNIIPEDANISAADIMNNQQSILHEVQNLGRNFEDDLKLPHMNISPFSGNYNEFPSFQDLFEASIHNKANLSDVHKLQYLKGLLKGEAAELIRHISITEANYQEAWGIIKNRYDKKGLVIANLIEKFMEQPIIQIPSSKNLRNIADVSTQVLRTLKVLGNYAESRDPWLIYIIVSKLDEDSKEAWASVSFDDETISFEKFIHFLNRRSESKAAGERNKKKNSSGSRQRQVHGTFATTEKLQMCSYCNDQHAIYHCDQFLELSIIEKKSFVETKKLCFNCLKEDHMANKCKSKFSCWKCKKRHHTILHQDTTNSNDESQFTSNENLKLNSHSLQQDGAILPTAIVYVSDVHGRQRACRAMLDSGAEASFVSESCVQRLHLPRKNSRISITSLTSGTLTTRGRTTLDIHSKDLRNNIKINALIINKLNCRIPSNQINIQENHMIKDLKLADPNFCNPAEVDIIIGVDKFFHILTDGKIFNAIGTLLAQNTIFGWVLAGQNHHMIKDGQISVNNITINKENCDNNLDVLLTKFWENEDYPQQHIATEEEMFCEKFFSDTTVRKAGRFEARLPFKTNTISKLGTSKNIAKRRLISLENKLSKNPSLKEEYKRVIQEYLTLGHIKIVEDDTKEEGYYLPHREVLKESSTTSVRVVFDGSSKTSTGVSINDILHTGPAIQHSLWNILIRFRFHPYVVNGDVEKMYRQVNLHPDDQIYQKILWRNNINENIKTYQLTTVTFGLACSSFLAIRSLQQCAYDNKDENPSAINAILEDFYVDDLLTGAKSIQEAKKLKKDIQNILKYGGFNIRKWKSNSKDLCEENLENTTDIENPIYKILGLQWNFKLDVFIFQIKSIKEDQTTKRMLISNASKIFDPMGWLSPSTILIKILFQKLWMIKIDWDDPIPSSIDFVWNRIKDQLQELKNIQIPRYISTEGYIELHGFCDASERAYAAVIYLRSYDETQNIQTSILVAKTKVAPIKQISLPRLELCGALLLSKLMKSITQTINNNKLSDIYAWTDSTIVLNWLSDHPSRWKSYIGNRTSEILTNLPMKHWGHVRSSDNPADYASRGILPAELIKLDKWWNGPNWLKLKKENWPDQTHIPNEITDEHEERENVMKIYQIHIEKNDVLDNLIEKTNSFMKILRILCYIRRFGQKQNHQYYITSKELNEARNILIKWVQQSSYQQEITSLKTDKEISRSSKLAVLAPFLDDDGVLRVGGRIKHAHITYNHKHPIILPKTHILTKLIINYYHLRYLHSGPSLTSHLIRQEYWIVQGRNLIRSLVNKCVICFKNKAVLSKQLMGNLPECRLLSIKPFTNTGVDYAGPIMISSKKGRGAKHLKSYVAVFVCLSTKAVHLELSSDLSTDAFLACLKRFVSRRGLPKSLYSDNGKNFVGAHRKLEETHKFLINKHNHSIISNYLSESNIEWHFIPPSAPNFGGIWEAAVKSFKTHLSKCINNCYLTYEEMSTLLAEIEGILNSRPICQQSEDDSTYEPLTPGHFLIGTPIISLPQKDEDDEKNLHTRWQQVQARAQSFWKRFSKEYFNQLQVRYKWQSKSQNLQIDDIVLVKEDNMPSCKWLIGKIIKLHPGDDKLVRVASIKTSSSIIKRPINKLARIPLN